MKKMEQTYTFSDPFNHYTSGFIRLATHQRKLMFNKDLLGGKYSSFEYIIHFENKVESEKRLLTANTSTRLSQPM